MQHFQLKATIMLMRHLPFSHILDHLSLFSFTLWTKGLVHVTANPGAAKVTAMRCVLDWVSASMEDLKQAQRDPLVAHREQLPSEMTLPPSRQLFAAATADPALKTGQRPAPGRCPASQRQPLCAPHPNPDRRDSLGRECTDACSFLGICTAHNTNKAQDGLGPTVKFDWDEWTLMFFLSVPSLI